MATIWFFLIFWACAVIVLTLMHFESRITGFWRTVAYMVACLSLVVGAVAFWMIVVAILNLYQQ